MYLIFRLRGLQDTRGQDLIEYALMAGFVAVAGAAVMPSIYDSVFLIMAKVWVVLACASGNSQGCDISGDIL